MKFSDAGIQDVSTSISITVKFEEMTDDDEDDDESDKHLEARDRRYSCLIFRKTTYTCICKQTYNFEKDLILK